MKNLKLLTGAALILLLLSSVLTRAQSSNSKSIPQNIIAAFNTKYPKAAIKKWKAESGKYTIKAMIGKKQCFVQFDTTGTWISTVTKITWPWKLPKAVNSSYNKTKYWTWHISKMMRVEKPSGIYYEVIVDNGNQMTDASHQSVVLTNKLLQFKADGTLSATTDISDNPVSYSTELDPSLIQTER